MARTITRVVAGAASLGLTLAGGLALGAPTASAAAAAAAAAGTPAGPNGLGVCANCSPPLLPNGNQVLGGTGTPGTVTLTPVLWTPPGYDFSSDPRYPTLIDQYLQDVAAASTASTVNSLSVNTEYSDGSGAHLSGALSYGTPIVDTNPFVGDCTPAPGASVCISTAAFNAELQALAANGKLTADRAHLYIVLLPPKVSEVDSSDGTLSCSGWGGYHSSITTPSGDTLVFSNEPYYFIGADNTACYQGDFQSPNDDPTADGAISVVNHEVSEALTDTGSGWSDSHGNEIGDECNYKFDAPLGRVATPDLGPQAYNQVVNGHDYFTQTEFSNAALATYGTGYGCLLDESQAPAGAAATSDTAPPPGGATPAVGPPAVSAPGSVQVIADNFELPTAGESTPVRVSVYDADGNPVAAGDTVHVTVRSAPTSSDGEMPGSCGKVSPGQSASQPLSALSHGVRADRAAATNGTSHGGGVDAVTDATGQVTVTYTASGDSLDCLLVAADLNGGSDGQAIVYQGSLGQSQASHANISETDPVGLRPGGAPVPFHVTLANPTATDITHVGADLQFVGDDTATTGVDASQLTVEFYDGRTWQRVPLNGSTTDGGAINGRVGPELGATLASGAKAVTVPLRASLAAGAPTTASTGSALSLESDLDQINPADGSLLNLDYTSSSEIPAQLPGYWSVAADGGVFAHGSSAFAGSAGDQHLVQPMVGAAKTVKGDGYWLAGADGGVFAYGKAAFLGSHGGSKLNSPIVGIASTPDDGGYWLVASDGGVFAYGDATFSGSEGGAKLNSPVVGITATRDGGGYWLVASDGGVFAFGDATFHGSEGATHLNKPIVGIASTGTGAGYLMVGSDGGVFTFGDATFHGSEGGGPLNRPIVGIAPTDSGQGYWLVGSDGGIFGHGDAAFEGSEGGTRLARPVVGITSQG